MEGRYISPLSELLWFLITAVYNRCPIVHLQMVCYRLYSLIMLCVCVYTVYVCMWPMYVFTSICACLSCVFQFYSTSYRTIYFGTFLPRVLCFIAMSCNILISHHYVYAHIYMYVLCMYVFYMWLFI